MLNDKGKGAYAFQQAHMLQNTIPKTTKTKSGIVEKILLFQYSRNFDWSFSL